MSVKVISLNMTRTRSMTRQDQEYESCSMITLGVLDSVSKGMGLELWITQVSFQGYSGMCYNNIMIMS